MLSPAVSRALGSATAVSLFPYISLSHSHSLNTLPPPSGLPLILRPYDTRNRVDDDASMASLDGGDAEVIAHVAFSEPVKVKMIVVHAGRGEEAPRVCKVWVNRAQGVSFDDAAAEGPDQDWELQQADEAIAYPTRLSKFHNVASLTFHFVSLSSSADSEPGADGDIRASQAAATVAGSSTSARSASPSSRRRTPRRSWTSGPKSASRLVLPCHSTSDGARSAADATIDRVRAEQGGVASTQIH